MDVSALSRQSIYDWLDAVERLVALSDQASLAALAQTELVRLTNAWRELLREHEPTEGEERCRTCARRRRYRASRCEVWTSAHRLLIKTDSLSSTEPGHGSAAWSPTTIRRSSSTNGRASREQRA